MNLLPDLAGWIGDLDFVPTATFVNGLCRHIARGIEPRATFEHYPGLVKLDVPEMTHWLGTQVEVEKFGRLNVLKWLGRIRNLGFEHVIVAQHLALKGVESAVSRRKSARFAASFPMLILGNLTFSLNQNIVWLRKLLFVVWIFRWNYYLGFWTFF